MASNYILAVTAGPTYEDQKPIGVNTSEITSIASSLATIKLSVRIQNYRGLPEGSPKTSPYFSSPPHTSDLYSISFSLQPKADINGHDLVFGNDFDHPIRDRLPPGFNQATKIVTWFIDPGLYGDMYAEEPYLYGPLLSSINVFRVGAKGEASNPSANGSTAAGEAEEAHVFEEGADDAEGEEVRNAAGIPSSAPARQKFFLTEANLKEFTFEAGREYKNDFFNPYLDFNEFALRLPGYGLIPGITIPIVNYWDGQPLRYVLKNRATNETLFVVVLTLVPKEQQNDAEVD